MEENSFKLRGLSLGSTGNQVMSVLLKGLGLDIMLRTACLLTVRSEP